MKSSLSFATFGILLCFLSCERMGQDVSKSKIDDAPEVSFGRYRNYEQAKAIAEQSINLVEETATKSGIRRKIESVQCITEVNITKGNTASEDTLMYVFNFAGNEGFSLIAAEKTKRPVLAVTEAGHYDIETGTGIEAVDSYIDGLRESLRGPGPGDPIVIFSYNEYFMVADSCVNIMPTKWGQQDIYGQYCPNGISGCVATALGQILAFKHIPSSFETTVQMGNDYAIGDIIQPNWNVISQHIQTHSDTQSCNPVHNQIGALLREIGDLVNMTYNPNSSGATITGVQSFLNTWSLPYSPVATANPTTITTSISSGYPVFMCGTGFPAGGHAWVADGYKIYQSGWITYELLDTIPEAIYVPVSTTYTEDTKLLHLNWGWNGNCNGYFDFDCYDTSAAATYDGTNNTANYNFNSNVLMICNIGNNS